jgi:hypothetical protein
MKVLSFELAPHTWLPAPWPLTPGSFHPPFRRSARMVTKIGRKIIAVARLLRTLGLSGGWDFASSEGELPHSVLTLS